MQCRIVFYDSIDPEVGEKSFPLFVVDGDNMNSLSCPREIYLWTRKSFSVCSKREREKERRGEFLFRYWTEYIFGDDREIWRGADDDWGRGIPRSGTVIVLLIIIEGEKTDRLDVSFLILTVWGLGQFERYDTYAFLFVSSLAKLFSWSWWIIVISFLFDSDYLRSWGPWCGLIWAYISVFIVRRIKYEKIQD